MVHFILVHLCPGSLRQQILCSNTKLHSRFYLKPPSPRPSPPNWGEGKCCEHSVRCFPVKKTILNETSYKLFPAVFRPWALSVLSGSSGKNKRSFLLSSPSRAWFRKRGKRPPCAFLEEDIVRAGSRSRCFGLSLFGALF